MYTLLIIELKMVIDYQARKQYMKDYYKRNKEKINERQTKYIKDHADERREYRKERYQAHRELQIKRVIRSMKKYHRWPFSQMTKVRVRNYRDQLDNAKTEREKVMIRKKIERVKKSAITLRIKGGDRKRERVKQARKEKFSI